MRKLDLRITVRPCDAILQWRSDGDLYLDPPYQRGVVWGLKRQANLIRSVILGVPIPSIVINDRMDAGRDGDARFAVIDGKQRITALLNWFDGKISVPGSWLDAAQQEVRFSELPISDQRIFKRRPLSFCECRLPTLDGEREVFDLINFGGLKQGEGDE